MSRLALMGAGPSAGGAGAADVTAPVLSAASGAALSETSLRSRMTTDEGNGTIFTVASTASNVPSKAQIEAGQMHTGAAAAGAANAAVSLGVNDITVGSLSVGGGFYLHSFQRDVAGNESNVVSSAIAYTWMADAYIETQNTDTGRGGTLDGANNEINWTNINIGAAHPSKKLIAVCHHNGNSTRLTAFEASGLTFTKLASYGTADDTNNANTVAAFIADAPNGGSVTGLKVKNDSGADPARGSVSFYTTMRSATLHDILKHNDSAVNSISGNVDLDQDGLIIALSTTTTASNDCDWTGVVEDNDDFAGATNNYSAGHLAHSGAAELNRSIVADWTVDPSNNIRLLALSFARRS